MTIAELSLNEELDAGYLGRILRLTSLAPDIIKSVLAGTQPADFILKRLIRWEMRTKIRYAAEIFFLCLQKNLSYLFAVIYFCITISFLP